MPDILIRMEMPVEQPVTLILDPSGRVWLPDIKTNKEYMARELPPHGDLIDVSKISLQEYEQAADDALHNGKGSILYDCGVLAGARAITLLVRRAPVVIPAERSGE